MMWAMAEAEGIAGLDTGVAHPARVYDYWLGGTDNFAANREAAERVLAAAPGLRYRVRANRAFLGRATRFLAAEAALRQFLDIGTGIPAAGNTHEVAQRVAPDARVVYVTSTRSSCCTRRPCCAVPRRGRPRICRPTCVIPRRSWTVRHPCWTSASRWRSCCSACCT
jgi:hypothetical protein